MISEVNERYERQYSDVMTLQMLVAQLPRVNAQIEEVMGSLGDLESLFGDVEISLLGLEDTSDAREMQERQLDQRFQVALYQERRRAEFNDLSSMNDALIIFTVGHSTTHVHTDRHID